MGPVPEEGPDLGLCRVLRRWAVTSQASSSPLSWPSDGFPAHSLLHTSPPGPHGASCCPLSHGIPWGTRGHPECCHRQACDRGALCPVIAHIVVLAGVRKRVSVRDSEAARRSQLLDAAHRGSSGGRQLRRTQ